MKKLLILLFVTCALPVSIFAQGSSIDDLIEKGIKEHDNGHYVAALEYYRQALHIDSNASRANYEMGNTYIALEKYDNALYYVNKVLERNGDYMDQAYTLKGTALDLLGKYDEALQVYREGVKKFPNNYLLQYNTALTYFEAKQYSDAEGFAIDAIKAKMSHPSSHLILGYCKYYEGHRVEALLCWYYFLMLEPNSKRAENTLKLINKELNIGVTKEGDDKINISIPSGAADGEFATADIMLSMLAATKYTEKGKKQTEEESFYSATESFFGVLGALKDNDKGKKDNPKTYPPNVWSGLYVPFFYALAQAKHTETLCYYITSSKDNDTINSWLKDHKSSIGKFSDWYNNYYKKD